MNARSLTGSHWIAAVAVTAAVAALCPSTMAGAAEAKPAPGAPTTGLHRFDPKHLDARPVLRDPRARRSVFVEFTGLGAADVSGRTAVLARRDSVARRSLAALTAARSTDAKATSLFTVSNAVPGAGIVTNAKGVAALKAMPGVVKVSAIVPKTFENSNAGALVKALDAWKYAGGTGSGVRVGVIDTGLDYTHADFGGAGTEAAYGDARAVSDQPGWRAALPTLSKAKVRGGYDFAGDDYDADPTSDTFQPTPHPDTNPLDCGEHGTHVAGTAAGYGVTSSGKTFKGSYGKLTRSKLMSMKVGPGMAPRAELYALKVFGCEGSTDLVIPALDWALDPNGDGSFKDHLDIVNLSLGSDYGNEDDPENAVIDKLARKGVLPVLSMGNNGDLTDTGGSPGNAVSGLAVASTVDSYQLRDGLLVNAPGTVQGIATGQMSVDYDWPGNGPTGNPVTGDVVAIPGDNADGCDALSVDDAAAVDGKVAWLVWDDNDATRRCGSVDRSGNVKAAGAIGAIFTSGLDVFNGGISGDADIPVVQLPKTEVDRLQGPVDAHSLNVTFDGSLQASTKDVDPAISDTLSSFSSRGTHGSIGVVKPDVAAPGDSIASALMGSGHDAVAFSGTSMASPMTAGVSAIVKAQHPGWSPLLVKAAVMNNAGNDVWTGPHKSGRKYGPTRVGAGRIDARAAARATVLAYVDNPANAVSASFGPVEAPIDRGVITKSRRVTVRNTGKRAVVVTTRYQAVISSPGVTYAVSPRRLTVPGGKTRAATLTMSIRPRQLRHTLDPTMSPTNYLGDDPTPRQYVSDASGRVLITPHGKNSLRVPVYGAAKPVATTVASVGDGEITLSGRGILQGSGAQAYESFVSVMQLGASSPRLPECSGAEPAIGCASSATERAGDIKQIGAGAYDDMLWFGVATHGDWANVGNVLSPDVLFDTDSDGTYDYETYATTWANPGGNTDILVAVTLDLADGSLVDVEPVNFNTGDVDTNVFDSNVLLLPVWKDAVGLPSDGTSAPISYEVGTYYGYTGDYIDDVAAVDAFDAGTPVLATNLPVYSDQGDSAIPYTATSPGMRALIFHLHGAKGSRSQVLVLP